LSTGYRPNAVGAGRASEDRGHVRVLIGCDFGVAVTAAILAYGWVSQSHPGWVAALAALGIALFGLAVGLFASAMALSLVIGVVSAAMFLARKASGAIRRARRVIVVVAVVIGVLAAWWVAVVAAAGVVSALPSLLPLGCAAYVGVLTFRDDPRPGRWAEVFLAGAVGVGLAAVFRPGIVADDPAAFLLFIAIGWLAARMWRSMSDSGNRMIRGSADVATALLLGATLDLVVVWIGNLAGLPALTVLRVSHLLNAVAAGSDPAWWYLAVPLLLLAVGYVALIRWGSRLAELGAWAQRRRLVGSARKLPGIGTLRPRLAIAAFDSSRRLMQFLHVGLLLVPLVGMTAPALFGQAVLGPLRPRYFIAYDAERNADAQVLAYRQLTREVAAASPSQRAALRNSVADITSTLNGSGGAGGVWFTAASPAAGLGEEEGAYLEQAGEAATGVEPAPPPLATSSATAIAAQVEAEEGDADEAESYADKAGASAAAAIATLLSIPPGGGAVQILQEYLGGLTEESPVADALAGLAGRLGGDVAGDPDVEQALNPGPAEQAAASGEISQAGDNGSGGSGGGSSTGDNGGSDDGGDDGGGGDSGGGDGGGGDGD
jgi:hypothetical protein